MAAMRLSSSMVLTLLPLLLLAAASTIPSLASASGALDHGPDDEGLLMLGRFHRWMAAHGRSYATEEEKLRRFGIYRSNMKSIEAANKDARMRYQLGETPFTDLTHEEFKAMYTSGGLSSPDPEGEMITTRAGPVHEGGGHGGEEEHTNLTALPASVDWRRMGVVTPAKNQGTCGCCWAFASVATMESALAIRTRRTPHFLSEQQLVDCDGYDMGCRGGWLGNAFRWVIQNRGITWAASYPYIGRASGHCQAFKPAALRLRSYQFVANREVSLMQAVALQPVAVTINADDPCFQHYYNGVYDGSCSWNGVYVGGACGTAPNHAIAIVGYGAKPDGTKYWIAKNSWSQTWGEKGFAYILKGAGVCSLAHTACYPII